MLVITLVEALQNDEQSTGTFTVRENAVLDVLGWIPATGESRRAYAAWTATGNAPLTLADAITKLGISPAPLALGTSTDWQRLTGISGSQVTAWAASPGASVTVLKGSFDRDSLARNLSERGYSREIVHGIAVWINPIPVAETQVTNGDDLRSLNAVAIADDRIVLGIDRTAIVASLDVASGAGQSLADDQVAHVAVAVPETVGLMVVDLRDMAVSCGLANGWDVSDFQGSSGRSVAVTWGYAADGTARTSVWTQFADNDRAFLNLEPMQVDWMTGYISQMGVGEAVATFATVTGVSQSGPFVVADLANGGENGWVRSGIRYLISICEQSSVLVPVGSPEAATPQASAT